MTARKMITRTAASRKMSGNRVKDEVYRQMFLLEECRSGAEMGLALALLRAWLAVASNPTSNEERKWLKNVSPICLEMIEATLKPESAARPCVRRFHL